MAKQCFPPPPKVVSFLMDNYRGSVIYRSMALGTCRSEFSFFVSYKIKQKIWGTRGQTRVDFGLLVAFKFKDDVVAQNLRCQNVDERCAFLFILMRIDIVYDHCGPIVIFIDKRNAPQVLYFFLPSCFTPHDDCCLRRLFLRIFHVVIKIRKNKILTLYCPSHPRCLFIYFRVNSLLRCLFPQLF